ncbi:MAG: hypothetical protein ACO21E_07735 [Hylemonella sp.]
MSAVQPVLVHQVFAQQPQRGIARPAQRAAGVEDGALAHGARLHPRIALPALLGIALPGCGDVTA